jgi:DNA-binding NarL/FixJ family response regulator
MPQKPTTANKIAALMRRQAIVEGHKKGVAPEVGRRIALKPETVRAIRDLAKRGLCRSEIARELGLKESGVRRYAQDYGIEIPQGDRGGPGAKRLAAIARRQERVARLLDEGWTQRAIAKKLGLSTFTICRDAQYVRARRKQGEAA